MNKLESLLFDLKFHADYDREKQRERLTRHLDSGASIASFLYSEPERVLDGHHDLFLRAHAMIVELTEPKKPFWHRFKK